MRLVIESGSSAGVRFRLPPGATVIGRAADCDVVVPDAGVSGRHAEIVVGPGGRVTVRDLGSRTGTEVDGERIDGTWAITAGAQLRFGDLRAVLAADQPSGGITAEFPAAVEQRPSTSGRRRAIVVAIAAVVLASGAAAAALLLVTDEEQSPASTQNRTAAKPTPPRPPTEREIIARARRATVLVTTASATGSGVVVERRPAGALVITNQHVVSDGGDITVNLDNQSPRAATLVGASECDDLAVLNVPEADGLAALTLGGAPELGQQLFVFGFPVGLADSLGFQVRKANVAILDAKMQRSDRPADAVYRDLIQLDGNLIPGNSGGPLVALDDGRVVGINALTDGELGTRSRRRALRRCWRTCARARSSRACRSSLPGMTPYEDRTRQQPQNETPGRGTGPPHRGSRRRAAAGAARRAPAGAAGVVRHATAVRRPPGARQRDRDNGHLQDSQARRRGIPPRTRVLTLIGVGAA